MAEYIEREALITLLNGVARELLKDNSIQCSLAAGIVVDTKDNVVAKMLTADVVEVVRCKDCKHYKTDSYYCQKTKQGYCEFDNNVKQKQGYCSYGERRCAE